MATSHFPQSGVATYTLTTLNVMTLHVTTGILWSLKSTHKMIERDFPILKLKALWTSFASQG
jgi:hypothetical protein